MTKPTPGLVRPADSAGDGFARWMLALTAVAAPEDLNVDDGEPIEPRLSRRFRSHLSGTADGAVRQVGRDWGEQRWRAFLRIQGPVPRWE